MAPRLEDLEKQFKRCSTRITSMVSRLDELTAGTHMLNRGCVENIKQSLETLNIQKMLESCVNTRDITKQLIDLLNLEEKRRSKLHLINAMNKNKKPGKKRKKRTVKKY